MEGGGNDTFVLYAPRLGPRLQYITTTLLPGAILVDSKEEFLAAKGTRLNYSAEAIANVFQVIPYGLLEEDTISEQNIHCTDWEGLPVFFQTGGAIPFDFLSASFYLLSRYEEYLPYEPDAYGRYPHEASLAYHENFLDKPLVNLWLQSFIKKLSEFYFDSPPFTLYPSPFTFIPTYDVDEAFSYLHKPVWKNVLGFFRDLIRGEFEAVVERGNVYTGQRPDPYDTFAWLDTLHERYQLRPVYFFLTILKRGVYDKNLPAHAKPLQALYRELAGKYTIGLHPSWHSGTEPEWLAREKEKTESITGKKVFLSRNHYLRFTIPHTYRKLLAAGMTDEYSMGYGASNGFRASYAKPFNWYDLEKEEVTELKIHSFCFMEATSFFSQGYSATEAGDELQYYHDTVKRVNGEFITLFHNHFLTEQPRWIAWREMYAAFLEQNFR